jgi:lipopolysaccharide transport system permease protein
VVADPREGINQSWLRTMLAHQDLKLRYRGSILGPFWQRITTVVMIGAMGFIYAKLLFNTPMQTYLPLLSAGLVFWQFISEMIIEGCGTFFSQQGVIQQVSFHYRFTPIASYIVTF